MVTAEDEQVGLAGTKRQLPRWRRAEARLFYRASALQPQLSTRILGLFFLWSAAVSGTVPRGALLNSAPDFWGQALSILTCGRVTFAAAPHWIAGIDLVTAGLLLMGPGSRTTLLWLLGRLVLGLLPLFMFRDQMWQKFPVLPTGSGFAVAGLTFPVVWAGMQAAATRWAEMELRDETWDCLAETPDEAAQRRTNWRWAAAGLALALVTGWGAEKTAWPAYLNWFHARQEAAAFNEQLSGKLVKKSMPPSRLLGGRKITTWVYLPPGYDRSSQRYPVVYVMHGMPGEVRDCFVKGRVQDDAERLIQDGQVRPFIIVGWDGEGPGGPDDVTNFLDRADGSYPMESFIVKELVPYIDATYRTIASPQDRALDGISAGGYAAANLTLKHPNVFKIGASHNGFFSPFDENSEMTDILGREGVLWKANDPFAVARTRSAADGLHFYGDIGEGDDLQEEFVKFGRALKNRGIPCEMHVFPGRHTWEFWSQHFNDSFRFEDKWFRHPE